MKYYHATSPKRCKFNYRGAIDHWDDCPKCHRPFKKIIEYDCKGCNTIYRADIEHNVGDTISCDINGETVTVTSKDGNQTRTQAPQSKRGLGCLKYTFTIFTLLSLWSLFELLGGFAIISSFLSLLSVILSVVSIMVLTVISILLIPVILNITNPLLNHNSTFKDPQKQGVASIMNINPINDPSNPREIAIYVKRSRKIIINQQVIMFILSNILITGAFICTSPNMQVNRVGTTSTQPIAIQAIGIGTINTIIFASIFYAGKFLFELDKRLRERKKIVKTVILITIFGASTVITLLVVQSLEKYFDTNATALALVTNMIADTCIMFEEALIRFYLERIEKPIKQSLLGMSSNYLDKQIEVKVEENKYQYLIIILFLFIICFAAILWTSEGGISLFPGQEHSQQAVPTLGPVLSP